MYSQMIVHLRPNFSPNNRTTTDRLSNRFPLGKLFAHLNECFTLFDHCYILRIEYPSFFLAIDRGEEDAVQWLRGDTAVLLNDADAAPGADNPITLDQSNAIVVVGTKFTQPFRRC